HSDWPVWVMAIWGGLLIVKVFKLFLLDKLLFKWQKNRLMSLTRKN
ncbi:DNA-binding protein, partial [Salmonella enterica subsp. enterica serovar Enteritidis]|nr:DNA-binding protein [Salmonella enterica subsp. enterica serovar Enteritidis]